MNEVDPEGTDPFTATLGVGRALTLGFPEFSISTLGTVIRAASPVIIIGEGIEATGELGLYAATGGRFEGPTMQIGSQIGGTLFPPSSGLAASSAEKSILASIAANRQAGLAAQSQLRTQIGGEENAHFSTSYGARYVDVLDPTDVANEVKVGQMALTRGIQLQIDKDVHLKQTGAVTGVIWNFYRSPVTGLRGPNASLRNELQKNGIQIVVH